MKQVTQKYRSASTYGENIDGNCDGTPKSTTSIATKVYSDMPAHSFPSQCNETPIKAPSLTPSSTFSGWSSFFIFFLCFQQRNLHQSKENTFFCYCAQFFCSPTHVCQRVFKEANVMVSNSVNPLQIHRCAASCDGIQRFYGAIMPGERRG